MKKGLIGVSGGTSASMSAFEKSFIKLAIANGYEMYSMPEFWRGIVEDKKPKLLSAEEVKTWDNFGGSPFIPSCKNTNVLNYNGINMAQKVVDFCNQYDFVIIVGGDGTTKQVQELLPYGLKNVIIAAATMDNDIPGLHCTLGFKTAVEEMGKSIFAAYCDAMTMQRPTIVFSMGYDCTAVATASTLKAIELGANVNCLNITRNTLNEVAQAFRAQYHGGAYLLVVGESACDKVNKTGISLGHIHNSYDYEGYVEKVEAITGVEFKKVIGDYTQRAGIPSCEDKAFAKSLAQFAISFIKYNIGGAYVIGEGLSEHVVAINADSVATEIREVGAGNKAMPNNQYFMTNKLKKITI